MSTKASQATRTTARPAQPRFRGLLRGSTWLVGATILASLIAVLPIIGEIVRPGHGATVARTAFAAAGPGEYVVASRSAEDADIILVAPAGDPSAAIEVARVAHVAGFAPTGAVSPDGRRVALVVADGGTQGHPSASLVLLDLDTGSLKQLATGVEELQTALWAPDGKSIVVSRASEGSGSLVTFTLGRVAVDGAGETVAARFDRVLGAYPVAFDRAGRLVVVVIDARGSTVYRDAAPAATISSQITRDWKLSPDGSRLAFIESNVTNGLHYLARVVTLDGGSGSEVAAQSALNDEQQQLGVSWKPGSDSPTFGSEPASIAGSAGVFAQSVMAGFDIPLSYSPDGSILAVQHWTGTSYSSPGKMTLDLTSADGGRTPLDGFSRFFGWATR